MATTPAKSLFPPFDTSKLKYCPRSCTGIAEVALFGFDGFLSEYAHPKRLSPLILTFCFDPDLPVQEVQPVHLAVTCQWVEFILVPVLKTV